MGIAIAELDTFEALHGEWQDLQANSSLADNIFSTWDWQNLWWRVFGAGKLLRLIAIRADGALIGIWPLFQERDSLVLVGGVEVCDYLGILARRGYEDEVLIAGVRFLGAEGGACAIDLRFLPEGSPAVTTLPAIAERLGWNVRKSIDEVCPRVDLPNDWEQYLNQLTKKDRHELRRKLRRLEESGLLRYEVKYGEDGLGEDTADFLRLHRLSRPEKAAFMDQLMEHFFAAVIAHFRSSGKVRVYFLSFNERRVAAALCIDNARELWVYNSGFDRAYASLSVGLALKAFCIREAIAEGKSTVDFLRGREPYKYDLGAHDVPVYRIQIKRN